MKNLNLLVFIAIIFVLLGCKPNQPNANVGVTGHAIKLTMTN